MKEGLSEEVKQRLREVYGEKEREVKTSVRWDKRTFLENSAREAEEAARSQDTRTIQGVEIEEFQRGELDVCIDPLSERN